MAELVEIIGVTHNPIYYPRMQNPDEKNPGVLRVKQGFADTRQKLADARPDVLLCIGNDHLNQLFMDNMPAFIIGKGPETAGTWSWERRMSVPDYRAKTDVSLAKSIIHRGFDHGVDFAFSDELRVDHAFTIPLDLLRPERDLPVVPLICNVMAPPIPPARRFYQVGEALRSIVDEYPTDVRVAVVCSGHLSVEIGGPRGAGSTDPEFDRWSVELVGKGDVEAVCRDLTFERFWLAGNYTAGFLTLVMLLGLARGRAASHYETVYSDTNSAPFLTWDLYQQKSVVGAGVAAGSTR